MKKMMKKILGILAACFVAVGFAFSPLQVGAENSPEMGGSVVETPDISGETVVEGETPKTDEISEKITLEELLALVGSIAEQEGLGDEWQEAVANIRLAIEEKKLDITIVINILTLVVLVGYALSKWIGKFIVWIKARRNPNTTAQDIRDTQTAVGQQTRAVNALIKVDEQVAEGVEKENGKLVALATAQACTNTALRCLFRGIQMKAEIKDEAFRALNLSDEQCDAAKK